MKQKLYVTEPFCVKSEQGFFSGYASTYSKDTAGDQIIPGAFDKTLHSWKNKKKRFPHIYWEHNMEDPIGVCLDLKEDRKGLFCRGKLIHDFPESKKALLSIKSGYQGVSIGFFVEQFYFSGTTRCITSVSLKEISFVKFPCNAEALVKELKDPKSNTYDSAVSHVQDALSRIKMCTKYFS